MERKIKKDLWNSYLTSNGPLYVESFKVCRYFDRCRGFILLMSIPPRGEQANKRILYAISFNAGLWDLMFLLRKPSERLAEVVMF